MVKKNLRDLVFFHKCHVTFCSHVGTTHATEFCLKASGTTMSLIHSKEACGYTVAATNQKLTVVDVWYTDSPRVSLTLLNLSCWIYLANNPAIVNNGLTIRQTQKRTDRHGGKKNLHAWNKSFCQESKLLHVKKITNFTTISFAGRKSLRCSQNHRITATMFVEIG